MPVFEGVVRNVQPKHAEARTDIGKILDQKSLGAADIQHKVPRLQAEMLGPDPENHMLANIPRQQSPQWRGNVKPKPIARQGQLADIFAKVSVGSFTEAANTE